MLGVAFLIVMLSVVAPTARHATISLTVVSALPGITSLSPLRSFLLSLSLLLSLSQAEKTV